MTATFSKAAPADVALTVSTDHAVTLVSVKNGGAIVNASNYTYVAGVLTIKQAYLGGLANGDKVIAIVMSAGADTTATITVGA